MLYFMLLPYSLQEPAGTGLEAHLVAVNIKMHPCLLTGDISSVTTYLSMSDVFFGSHVSNIKIL